MTPYLYHSPAPRVQRATLPLTLLALLAVLLPLLQHAVLHTPVARPDLPEVARPVNPADYAPALPASPAYLLPEELAGKPELVELRTSHNAVFALGDGTYAALSELEPLHYQDGEGAWQPISTAFEPAEAGWINRANSVVTSLAQSSSAAKIVAGATGVAWQPTALTLAGPLGEHVVARPAGAATPLFSADNSVVRYSGGWDLAGMQEQWQARRGGSEYSYRLEAPPIAPEPFAPDQLDLVVRLTLLPGTQIMVDGQPVELPLSTNSALEFVGPTGDPLILAPPYAFEQAAYAIGTPGSYLLSATAEPEVVELRVRMPWSWLAAPERRYPVVVDPRFILGGVTTARQVRSIYPLGPGNQTPEVSLVSTEGTLPRIGYFVGANGDPRRGMDELALRFAMPMLPPNTQLTNAYFSAIPSDVGDYKGARANKNNSYNAPVNLYRITRDAWHIDNAVPTYDSTPIPVRGPSNLMSFSGSTTAEPPRQQALTWDVTSLAQSWTPQINVPTFNNGLLLRVDPLVCDVLVFPCRTFYFERNAWTETELRDSYVNSTPTAPQVLSSAQGGLRLLAFYSARTLQPNQSVKLQPLGDPTSPADNLPPGTIGDYYEAAHTYRIDGISGQQWYAVAARGIGPAKITQNPDNTIRSIVPVAGDLALTMSDAGAAETALRPSRSLPGDGKVSYMLLDGRRMAEPNSVLRQPRWLHLAANSYSNLGSGNDPIPVSANGYELVTLSEAGVIATQLTNTQTRYRLMDGVVFRSDALLRLYDLDLPSTSNSMVTVTVTGSNLPINIGEYAKHLKAEIVSSNYTDGRLPGPGSGYSTILPVKEGGYSGSSSTFTPGGGNMALVLSYNGPSVFSNEPPPVPNVVPEGEPESHVITAQNIPLLPDLRFNLRIEVISCPAGSYPVGGNACQRIECPAQAPQAITPRSFDGRLWLWSGAGWTQNGTTFTSVLDNPELNPAPLIGGINDQTPAVAVIGGQIEYTGTSLVVKPKPGLLGDVYLVSCNPNLGDTFTVYRGPMQYDTRQVAQGAGVVTIPVLEKHASLTGERRNDPWRPEDLVDLPAANFDFTVRPTQDAAVGTAELRRRLDPGKPTQRDLRFNTSWRFTVSGWLSPNVNSTISAVQGNPHPSDLAGLAVRLGNNYSLDMQPLPPNPLPILKTSPRVFEAVRASSAGVTQPQNLGGATKPVRVLLLPRGVARDSDIKLQCAGGSCLDIRGMSDTYTSPNRVWELPDVRTTGQAGTQVLSRAGEMLVFSADHPAASVQNVSQDFSFEAHKGNVTVEEARCVDDPNSPGYVANAPLESVVRGEVRIALPNIGSSGDPDALIAASFKLCGGNLRSVHMAFKSPVGVPIATTGLFLTGLSGSVDIFPTYTQIRVGVTFQAAQGGDGGLFTAQGEVLLDTRGLLEFQGNAKIMGVVNAQGRLWVAWNPLDVGIEAEISLGGWLRGSVRAHMWQGQGFGNRYSWLPNDNTTHFSGMIQAEIRIPKGAVAEIWGLKIPPSDITLLGFELAFGEFCTSSDCTQYEWGIKGKLVILGFDVGLYYGVDEGLDFILGNDSHILIDQYNGARLNSAELVAVREEGLNLVAAPQQVGDTASETLTIGPEVEQIMAAFSWMAGSPTFNLVRPDGTVIAANNADQYNATITVDGNTIIIVVQNPPAGNWQARFGNLTGNENYTFLYLANKSAPGTAAQRNSPNRLTVQPGANGRQNITWQVPPGVQPHHTISLFSRRTEVISGTLQQNLPIRRNLPYSQGSYEWDTNGMLNGAYSVYAVVDDGRNELPTNQISIPDDSCVPLHGPYPRARAFDAGRFPGTDIFTAPQTVQVNDTTPPPAPASVELLADDAGLLVRWQPLLNAAGGLEQDVSSYLIRWGSRVGNVFTPIGLQKVSARELPLFRIGGLRPLTLYGVAISALDANRNVGPESPMVFGNAGVSQLPHAPTNLARSGGNSTSVNLSWAAPASGPVPAGYEVSYTRLLGGSPDDAPEVQSGTLNVNGTSATLNNLTPAGTYEITVAARNANDWYGAKTAALRVVLSSSADGNNDGLPDDWATVYQVSSGATDSDGDGLTNAAEFALGTHPRMQDTDADGKSDGEEQNAGTDALTRDSFEVELLQPRLDLEEHTLTFHIRPQADAQLMALPPTQAVPFRNVGGGDLAVQADAKANPWITASVVSGQVQVGINPNGLEPGFHAGVVKLNQAGADALFGEPRCIRVKAWVYPEGADPTPSPTGWQVYVPLIRR